ncbi:hypothetical protein M3Y97_01021900 [Aphelenchoides bicaudatus]|nr:hypothetical protein M3Y97_01021900 [Aphelenchoides bicaudatus]
MGLNFNRMLSLPNNIKLFTLIATLLVLIFVGSAVKQPAGTIFVWSTGIFALIIDIIFILTLMMELDEVMFPRRAFLSWPLIECIWSILFAITYFISIWLCASGSNYGSYYPFMIAGIFCFANFVGYALNVCIFARLWANEQQIGPFGTRLVSEQTTYGAP